MSAFVFQGGAADPFYQKITSSTVTDITELDGTDESIRVAWMSVGENNGSTPNLTVEVYDGTTSFYLVSSDGTTWVAKAVTAKQGVRFNDGFVIPKGSKVRVTSSDGSGRFDVQGVRLLNAPPDIG